MGLHYFKMLSQPRQLDSTMREGCYLLSYKRYNIVIRLFQLENFYVEVYSVEEDGKVIMINAFDDTKYLEPYLESVDLSALMQL